MKKIIIMSLVAVITLFAQGMNSYCASPPFVGGKHAVVIPNVLITHDMTGSMRFWAYHCWGESYNPNITYYGYADPNSDYGRVSVSGYRYFQKKPAGSGTYSGNRINHAFMTRMDISRKAFTGGKGIAYNNKSRLRFEKPSRQSGFDGYTYYGIVTTDSTELSKGIIREIADTDSIDYVWDKGAPYFALQTFANTSRFRRKVKCPFGSTLIDLLTVLENQDGNNEPTGGTNCGDAIFEAIHYYRYCAPHWSGDYSWSVNDVGTPSDPWYEVVGADTVSVSCRPTFCIVVGDGGSNSDHPVSDCSHLPHPASPYGSSYWNFYQYDGDNDPYDPCNVWPHDRCGDDYAYYAHITDLRPDTDPIYGIPDDQTITFYSVYLFAQGDDEDADSIFFRKIAKYGGFFDSDTAGDPGYKKPDKVAEYDSDSDGRPDHFFYVNDGQQLEDALTEIFISIQVLSRVTSASSGAITGTGVKGAGLVYNAQFFPKMDLETTEFLNWLGKASALWIDPYGYLREDTKNERVLHLKDDYVVKMFFSAADNKTMAARFADITGLGDIDSLPVDIVPVESLALVWDAAQHLLGRDPDTREIFYNKSGVRKPFEVGQNWLDQHLDFGSADSCDTLIQYIRGYDVPNWRSRLYGSDVWKLGDIIYSSPMPVGEPSEAYHLVYGDNSYYVFWNQYRDRRTVVYTGANDGMLHAFNAGLYTEIIDPDPFKIAEVSELNEVLSKELWAFVPYNLLPHLKWLADTSYCHVYYVDLKPYPADVKIFTPGGVHPDGWGTILVSGMRFGGGEITVPGVDTYRSSYCCFDITDPETDNKKPQFMWEFTDDNLGYTLCLPGMVKVKELDGTHHWFLVFGSGPQTLYGECTQQAQIYIVDPLTGALIHTIVVPDDNSAVTNIFTVDLGLKYSDLLIYFGTYDNSGGGKIYRIMTHDNISPSSWTLHEVIDLGKPITAEGSASVDNRGNLWLYFGTGKYISTVDVADTTVMLFVGLKDDTSSTTPYTLGDLIDVTDVEVYADSVEGMAGVDNFCELEILVEGYDGWYRRFETTGERVITTPIVLGGAVVFTTFIPYDTLGTAQGPDLCLGGGGGPQAGNLWALYYLTGTAYRAAMMGEHANGEFKTDILLIGDMPSEPSIYIGANQEKIFVQSAGGLTGIKIPLPYSPRGGIMLWRGR